MLDSGNDKETQFHNSRTPHLIVLSNTTDISLFRLSLSIPYNMQERRSGRFHLMYVQTVYRRETLDTCVGNVCPKAKNEKRTACCSGQITRGLNVFLLSHEMIVFLHGLSMVRKE